MKRIFNVSPFILLLAPVFTLLIGITVLPKQGKADKNEITFKNSYIPAAVVIMDQIKK